MTQIDRTSREPLWSQLHTDLLRRLAAGDFSDGFPGEAHLRQEYGVSRHTVREALRRIREAGLVRSGRGRSSEVLATVIEQPLGGLYSLFREIEARGMTQESIVLACRLAEEPQAAARLALDPRAELFALERVRLADGEPLAHDCAWLPGHIGTPLLHTDFSRTALYDELDRHGIPRPDGGRERITATNLSPASADYLNVSPGTAALVIERTGLWRGEPIECRRTTIRSDRFALLMSWSGSGYEIQGEAGGDRRGPHDVSPQVD
ncbi:MAG: GntR family transcriptional regulator [Ornithinimicrobium sp.]